MSEKIELNAQRIPRSWYNIQADLPTPLAPPLGPDGKPITPDMLAPVFPMNIIEQEVSTQRWIPIPEPVLDIYSKWRPSPLKRARSFEAALGCPVRIFYKDEGVSPAGSHKPNTAIPQAYYNKVFGIKRLTTETGAGQWGSSLAMASAMFGLECKVYMVRISFDQKPFRKLMMAVWGAECIASPSPFTQSGREVLAQDPDCPGSLGIAISEAVEEAVQREDTRYSLGSVLNHVMMHQTIIGLEAKTQMESIGEYPDAVIGCVGGGSNFAGIAFPYVLDKIHGRNIDIIPAEPKACPTMTRGPFSYDYGDTAGLTPLLPMHSLGHRFVPLPIHAGGLRYHGVAPLISRLIVDGLLTPQSYFQTDCYRAAMLWARTEGFIPAPETSHAIAAVVAEAEKAKEEGKEKTILFSWSGHGLMDLNGYDSFMQGKLSDIEMSDEDMAQGLKCLEGYPHPPH